MSLSKGLSVILAFAATAGALSLTGCGSCAPETEKMAPVVTCGPGTTPQGNQCVGTVPQR